MAIEVININGRSPNLDYDVFERDAKRILGSTCQDAKIFVINNFPVAVTNTTEPDILIIISIEDKKGNYFIVKRKDGTQRFHKYLHCAIIPIVFNDEFAEKTLEVDDLGNLILGEIELDFFSEIQGLRKGVTLFLEKRCGLNEKKPRVFPQIFIKNPIQYVLDGMVIDSEFKFENLVSFLKYHPQEYINSYPPWTEEYRFESMGDDIKKILEQASLDSEEGFITLGKINRLGKENAHTKQIFDQIGQNLVMIKGKAGSGKSSELLSLTLKVINEDKNVLFLTYNKLLVFELSRVINSYKNNHRGSHELKGASVITLHQYFYRLSTKLGVKHILSAERIKDLTNKLKLRCRKLYHYLKDIDKSTNLDRLKEMIQNANGSELGIAEKELGVDFVNYLYWNRASKNESFNQEISGFYLFKKNQLDKIETDKIFLKDYYGILQNVLDVLKKPDDFYEKYDLHQSEKLEVFRRPANVSQNHIETNNEGDEYISKASFSSLISRKKSGFKWNRVLIIDEAQDCHRLEKEILLTIFGEKYAVVANGGKEQLIRHNELCNWTRFNGRPINVFQFTKRKSFRMKSAISRLCNFMAKKHNIDLQIATDQSVDAGEVIVDFRSYLDPEWFRESMNSLSERGRVNGCSNYESMMFLTNPGELGREQSKSDSALIDEYENIKVSTTLEREEGEISTILKDGKDFHLWSGLQEDKEKEGIPYPNDTRIIFYESCRGLEAWTVVCERLDLFFDRKFEHPESENFLVGDEKEINVQDMFLSNDERKAMFAATWVLMALTRAMDTLYISCEPRSKVGALLREFSIKEPNYVRVIEN